MLFDEPTNYIDPVRRKLVWDYMKKLAKNGHIVIVITHNLLEVEEYADRYVILDKGKVIKDTDFNKEITEFSTLSVKLSHDKNIINYPKSMDIKHLNDE